MRRRIRNSMEWVERQSQLSTELFCLAGDGCLGSSRFFDAVEAGQRERVLDSINRLVTCSGPACSPSPWPCSWAATPPLLRPGRGHIATIDRSGRLPSCQAIVRYVTFYRAVRIPQSNSNRPSAASLGELAFEQGVTLEVSLYGGAVFTLVYDSRDATKDVDAVVRPAMSPRI